MTSNGPSGLLKVDDVAERLRISPRTVWTRVSRGELPAPIRIGKLVRWRPETLDAWIARKELDALKEQERLARISS